MINEKVPGGTAWLKHIIEYVFNDRGYIPLTPKFISGLMITITSIGF